MFFLYSWELPGSKWRAATRPWPLAFPIWEEVNEAELGKRWMEGEEAWEGMLPHS